MNENHTCPAPEEILAWLDGELEDNFITQHTAGCVHCQSVIDTMKSENMMLCEILADLPEMPDITRRVMTRIDDVSQNLNHLSSLFHIVLVASLSFALIIFQNHLPRLINLEFWPVAVVQAASFMASLVNSGYQIMNYVSTKILPGEPLLPALLITAFVMLINLFTKRRLPNA